MLRAIIKFNNSRYLFAYCSCLIFLIFLITRLPYYAYYPVHSISSDSASYCAVALKLINGEAPMLDMRTPGYPLFLSLMFLFTKSFSWVIMIQSLLTLAASLFFLRALFVFYRPLSFLFAAAISVFISSSFYLILEFSILSELLFVVTLVVNSSFLIFAVRKKKIIYWMLYSASFAFLVLVRPVALFMVPGFILILVFFICNKFRAKFYYALSAPAFIILSALCLYNYFTIREFTISPVGDLNFSGVTVLFMEESPEYSAQVNAAIRKTVGSTSAKDRSYVMNSFDLSKFYKVYNDNFFRSWVFVDNLIKEDPSMQYMDVQPVLRKVSRDALKNHPDVYLKIVVCNLFRVFANLRTTLTFYDEIPKVYEKNIIDKQYIKELEDGEWRQFYSDQKAAGEVKELYIEQEGEQLSLSYIRADSDGKVITGDTFLKRVYSLYERIYNYLFRNTLWMIVFCVSFFLSMYEILKTKFRDTDCLIPGIFSVILISNAFIVSFLGTAIIRYTYAVGFVIYLSLPFLIILIKKFNKKISA